MYILTKFALARIESLRPAIISKLALALCCSDNTVYRILRENEENGDMTKYAALEVLREELNLSDKKIIRKVSEPEPVSK